MLWSRWQVSASLLQDTGLGIADIIIESIFGFTLFQKKKKKKITNLMWSEMTDIFVAVMLVNVLLFVLKKKTLSYLST